jgi:hypothetical protein
MKMEIEPCAVCKKNVRTDIPHFRVEYLDGYVLNGIEVNQQDSGYIGWLAVGSDCAKKLKKQGFKIEKFFCTL